jgi:hypothetical protein
MAALICPVMSRSEPRDVCIEKKCALWDEGAYDGYYAGCGLVSRENRRV